MLTVKRLKDWLDQFPDDEIVYGDYWETGNIIDLRVETDNEFYTIRIK